MSGAARLARHEDVELDSTPVFNPWCSRLSAESSRQKAQDFFSRYRAVMYWIQLLLLLSSYSYPAPTLIQLLLLLTRACETHGCTAEPPHPFTGISGHALRRHRLHRRRLSAQQFLICNEHGPAMLRGLRALRLEAHWSLVELVPLAAPRSATSLPLAEKESNAHVFYAQPCRSAMLR